ncbi:cyclic AMP-responsive element-binding protein 1-like isoform X6 [Homalodisca vitripennis]|uniref:cyclic AMP-responsive element-binding protein 1-like isoform X6 n=1 Tax=Homalodisca vitripennis TaxID=197043 RepID=UPI001EEB458E|nr:cyclic AMP-responsive element-binding protein 1-like isoform X6 [Homalodisca vitripennis]XP_046685802.1 cyclic AMP-responsive element-binding protein 1-like isoform X6 [Homalodisca vitripennis]
MDGMVEENGTSGGNGDPLAASPTPHPIAVTNVREATIVTYNTQPQKGQSVIQSNQQSVIQSANNQLPVLTKGNVILVGKPNSVIQTTQGNLQTLQVVEAGSDDSLSNDEDATTRKRRDILTRRPSYRKILNDLGGAEISGGKVESSGSDCDSNLDSELSSHSLPTHYQAVIPAGTIQLTSQGEAVTGLHTLTMTNATGGSGTLVQYTQGQDGQFYVPVVTQSGSLSGGPIMAEDQARKRELRLLKNREAARECRRKKKEYIKCLENRVAVLENQNKALIDELKSLKELYCQQKTE